MSTVAYCSECNARVALTSEGLCPNGHFRPALRDVRTLPDGPPPAGMNPQPRGNTEPRDARRVTPARVGLLTLLIALLVLATPALLVGGFSVFISLPAPTDLGGALVGAIIRRAGAVLISLALSFYLFAWICYRALRSGASPRRRWVTVVLVIVALALLVPGVIFIGSRLIGR